MDTEDERCEAWMAGICPSLNVGERVILTVPDPQQDGKRGVVLKRHPGDVYDVRMDEGIILGWISSNRLEREADYLDYPQPMN